MGMIASPNSRHSIAPAVKFGIGAGAGLCLALVKLVEANFFIGQPSQVAMGGALTMVAFAILAAVFTAFAEENDRGKLFMQGLLAPSLLIALIHRGVDAPEGKAADVTIPTLGRVSEFFVPTVLAQAAAPPAQTKAVQTIKSRDVSGSATDGALILLGRPQQQAFYVYVVGKTADLAQAQKTADRISKALKEAGASTSANVVRTEGSADFLVTVGSFQTSEAATRMRRDVIGKAVNAPQADEASVKLLVNGRVVDARTLVK
jgi:xanthine/uracil/vitamin C permease (AzgA family)